MADKRKRTLLDFFSRKKINPSEGDDIRTGRQDDVPESEINHSQEHFDNESESETSTTQSVDISLPSCSFTAMDNINYSTDISLFKHKNLDDHEKLKALTCTWTPETSYNFPLKLVGKQKRRFSHLWLTKYKWLSYSKNDDSAYCKICVLLAPREVGMSSSQSVSQLVTSGFDNWKKALERFDVHEKAIYHKEVVLKSNNFLNVISGKLQSIELSLDQTKNSQIQENKEKLRPIIQTVILCGRQGIALRGQGQGYDGAAAMSGKFKGTQAYTYN
jgi:hypothetical protein